MGNRAGIGAPQPSAPPTNPLQFISNKGNRNKMAEQAKQTMDKLKEQKHHGKQNKPEETDDIDWQSVCTQNSGLNAQNAVLNTQYVLVLQGLNDLTHNFLFFIEFIKLEDASAPGFKSLRGKFVVI